MPKDVSSYIEASPSTGAFRYRRGIPADLREHIGKREYRISLKTKDIRQATIKALMLAGEHDRIFAKFRAMQTAPKERSTLQQDHKDVIAWMKSIGYGADITPATSEDERANRMFQADVIEDKLIADAEDGKTSNPFDVLRWEGLRGKLGKLPAPSLSEAVVYYLIERNDKNRRMEVDYKVKFAREVNRYADDLISSMGKDKALDQIIRADGKAYVSYLETKGLAPASINKALRTVNTVFNYVNTEQELGLINRLKGMTVDDAVDDEDKRRSFTMLEMKAYLKAAVSSKDEIRLLIHLTSYTGTRHKELRGLRVDDFQLGDAVPHIRLRPYADRNLKTNNSRRRVPLVGGGLLAAKEAVAVAKADGRGAPDSLVFNEYQGVNGGNALSAILSKIIRERMKIADKLLTPYSAYRSCLAWTLSTISVPLSNALRTCEP